MYKILLFAPAVVIAGKFRTQKVTTTTQEQKVTTQLPGSPKNKTIIKRSVKQQVIQTGVNSAQPVTTEESWAEIVKSLITHNPKVKAAYQEYKTALAKIGITVTGLIMPDSIDITINPRSFNLDRESIGNPFDNVSKPDQHALSIKKQFGLGTVLNNGVSNWLAAKALANYEAVVIRELIDLLPNILLLVQADKRLSANETNVQRLKRSLDSTRARADKAIGLLAPSDLANANARYQAGLAQLISLKDDIARAKQYFALRVGRAPRTGLQALVQLPEKVTVSVNKAPAVKAAFAEYKAARASSVQAASGMLPSVTAEYRQGFGDSYHRTVSATLSCPLYNHSVAARTMETDGSARAALHLYKYNREDLAHRQQTFNSRDTAKIAELRAIRESVAAAERHALAEERKFNSGFQSAYDSSSILSPDTMLQAFKNAHDARLRQLDVESEIYNHRLRHILDFGILNSLKK